jgi:hypothetical protein
LREQDLTGAYLHRSRLTDVDLAGADLTNAWLSRSSLENTDFAGSIVVGARLGDVTSRGFTREQLYSTASYQQGDLQGIDLHNNHLEGWDFNGQDLSLTYFRDARLTDADLRTANLANAHLADAYLSNADLRGVNLKNAGFEGAHQLESAIVDSTTVYNQWTAFPRHFDPIAAGLTLAPSPEGDFNGDDSLDASDIDLLVDWFYDRGVWRERLPTWLHPMFDVDDDRIIWKKDHRYWVKDLQHTWYGDASLDGQFNSSDLTQVFAAGMYEIGWVESQDGFLVIHNRAGWAEGDWNGDGVFDSDDMVAAFADGGYEQGLKVPSAAVPEPTSAILLLGSLIFIATCRRRIDP